MPRKRHRLPLHHVDANLIGQHAHHRRMFNPGNGFKFPAPLADRHKKDVAADVFAEDRQHLRAADFREPGRLDIAGAFNAEAPVAFERLFKENARRRKPAENDRRAEPDKHASYGRGRPPQVAASRAEACPIWAWRVVAVGVLHLQRHARQRAPRPGHTLLHAPEARLRGRFILPNQRPGCSTALIHHA